MRHALVQTLCSCLLLCAAAACAGDDDIATYPDQSVPAGEDMARLDMASAQDQSPPVGGQEDMPQADAQPEGDMTDGGGQPAEMGPPPGQENPFEVIRTGSSGVVLRGVVLGAGGQVFDPGELLIEGGIVACVGNDCSAHPAYQGATVIKTHGIVSPGLVDAHNHVAYNFLQEWKPEGGKRFENRYQWADDPGYEAWVRPLTAHRSSNSHFCPAARWGELRSLLHGTTTIQGQSFERACLEGGVRNADHDHQLQHDHLRTTIDSPRNITDDQAQNYLASFTDPQEPITRFAVHMAEGYAGSDVTEEFASFAGRDPRDNRHRGVSLLQGGRAVLIHAVGVSDEELEEIAMTGSHVVWSPSSNMVLYGRTANIGRILELDISLGLGPDWTISGEDDMLAEIRYAHRWAIEQGEMRLTPRRIWEMATIGGARVVGLQGHVGELVPGAVADVLVLSIPVPPGGDPFELAVQATGRDVGLVLIGGQAWYGQAGVKEALGAGRCEAFEACGQPRFVCVALNEGDEYDSVSTIQGKLVDILEGTGYPAGEQYKRGGDLLPLIACP